VKLNRLIPARWLLGLLLMLVSACAGPFGIGVSGMTAQEIKEFAKIKDASVVCVRGVYAGALITVTSLNVDKGIPAGVTIKESCEVIFNTVPAPAKQP